MAERGRSEAGDACLVCVSLSHSKSSSRKRVQSHTHTHTDTRQASAMVATARSHTHTCTHVLQSNSSSLSSSLLCCSHFPGALHKCCSSTGTLCDGERESARERDYGNTEREEGTREESEWSRIRGFDERLHSLKFTGIAFSLCLSVSVSGTNERRNIRVLLLLVLPLLVSPSLISSVSHSWRLFATATPYCTRTLFSHCFLSTN